MDNGKLDDSPNRSSRFAVSPFMHFDLFLLLQLVEAGFDRAWRNAGQVRPLHETPDPLCRQAIGELVIWVLLLVACTL